MSDRVLVHADSRAAAQQRAKAMIFTDPKSQALLQQIEHVAASQAPVLIVGESGTGKELIARHLHERSGRKGAFVAVNCGALSQSLAEAELFGHQAGSFTGASETRAGWFETANGGTLFLDEIGDLPPALQVKLLRVLQEREVVRVGSRKSIPLDLRIVAATNADLAKAVTAGTFRLDLYYRLNVVMLDLPPLRERRRDILPLAEYFLEQFSSEQRLPVPTLTTETRRAIYNHTWPGNIRELENVIHYAVLVANDGTIHPEQLRFSTLPAVAGIAPPLSRLPLEGIAEQLDRLFVSGPADLFESFEELIIRRAFAHCSNNQVQTAKLLGISRNMLRTLLKRFGLISHDVLESASAHV